MYGIIKIFCCVSALIFMAIACNGEDTPSDPCTPLTCEDQGFDCGLHDDGCEGEMDCGECEPGYECEEGYCIPECVI